MKLNRRNFLKSLAVGVAGAALARIAGPVAEDVPRQDVSSILRYKLVDEAHPDIEIAPAYGIYTVGVASGSKVKATDVLTVDDIGFVKPALPGDWLVGFAVSDAKDDTVMVCLDPKRSFYA